MARKSKIWIDTSFIYAFLKKNDVNNQRAVLSVRHLRTQPLELFTSDLVVAETYTLSRIRLGWEAAQDTLHLFDKLHAKLLFGNRQIMDAAKEWASWKDQDFSFVDCISFAWMKQLRIPSYLSFDHHFQTAGFTFYSEG